SAIDSSIITLSLKTLQEAFHTNLGLVEWVALAYLLALICLLLSMGRLGDLLGKRRVYLAGFIIFTLGSALCGLAWSIEALLTFRVLQGIGAAMLQAVGTALLVNAFPPQQRGRALGYVGTISAIGLTIGP